MSGGSTALVRRSVFAEAWRSTARHLLVSHAWTHPEAPPDVDDDTVGFAFAHALPARAVLLDVAHARFIWVMCCLACFAAGVALTAWVLQQLHLRRLEHLERKYAAIIAEEKVSDPKLLRLVLDELPAWVRSGRYERTDWLCGALQAVWPHLERGLSRELQWRAEPLLRSLAPGFVRRVRVEELTLGSVAPRVTGALCADDDDADGVELELDVRWSCDGRGSLAFDLRGGRRLTFGVRDLTVDGLVRVRLAPLCSRVPGFAAVSLCFAAQPTVRYRLSGVGAVAASIPGFSAYLQRCVGDALSAAAVWPRQLVFPLPASVVGRDPDAVAFSLAPPAAGVLRVTLFDALDLSPAELLGLKDVALPGAALGGPGAAVSISPYVALDLPEPPFGGRAGAQSEATAHKRNNLSPRFDETFLFVVDDPATQRLRVAVRAWDATGTGPTSHSVMGETAVPLAGLRPRVADESYWSLSVVMPKSITIQGVMATYHVPSFGGELQEVPAGRLRMGLLYTPFRGSPGARRGSDSEEEEPQEEEEDDDDDDIDSDEDSDASSSGAEETEEAYARREARRVARRAARRRSRAAGARRGVLFVRVERATELRRATGAPRLADAYVTVMLEGERRREVRKTRVATATRSPVWNADFALFVEDAPRAELVCAAFDFSGVEAHIPMGEVRLPLLDIVAEQGSKRGVRESYPLLGAPTGTLQLFLEWRPY